MTTFLRRSGNLARLSKSSFESVSPPNLRYSRYSPTRLSRFAAYKSRTYATVNPGDPKDPKDKKDASPEEDGKTVAGKEDQPPGKVPPGFEHIYKHNSSPISPSPHDGKDSPPKSSENTAKLTTEEQETIDRLLSTLKTGLPTSQAKEIEKAFDHIKRDGIPVELREVMDSLKGGKHMDLATAAKLVRMTSQMARKAAEKTMGTPPGKEDGKPGNADQSAFKARPSSQSSGGQNKSGNQEGFKVPEFKMDPGTFLLSAFTFYLLYRLTSPGENSREITWQEFRTTFFDKGLVEKLTVVNRNRVRVDLHREATASMYPESPATQNNFHYYFSIGSVEAFERRLDDAQKELDIPSSERIPVAYTDEIS